MTLVPYPIGTANDGAVTLRLDYDDATLLITDLVLTNNSAQGTAILTGTDPGNGQQVFRFSRAANTGTLTQNVSGLGQHMVHDTGTSKYGPFDNIVPPFLLSFEWDASA